MTDTKKAKEVFSKSFRDFKTVSRANDPANTKPMDVVIPGLGNTGHKLYVRSRYCTEYRDAELKAQRQLLALVEAAGADGVNEDLKNDIVTRSLCALVAGWSFDEQPTPDNILELLKENPTVYEDLNKFAAKDSNFF
ncbi:hypothetical protein OMDBNIEC_00084 [Salmonella phage STP-SP5]|nr:hypothetical protein OMDBNIEC_00084 [Salmonella phage STP-SP5]